MTRRLLITPLTLADIDPLAALLMNEPVYRHIGGVPESLDRFRLATRRALGGPPPGHPNELWLNHGVRLAETGELLGRLEASIHGQIAEVAFLFGPAHWGKGYATEGLQWMHDEIQRLRPGIAFWGTTVPDNTRSSRLMTRCGYLPVRPADAPALDSYDDGDLVFTLSADRWHALKD
ncbi:MAG: GNAT family N-acetyltransferase [Burkholderiaceae bacterium]